MALGLRLATWFGRLWLTRGQMNEGNLWLERMLALAKARGEQATPSALRVKALYWAARIAMHLGRTEQAGALAREALALARESREQDR